ncbi:uncharacterized protein [Aquarana catesbeiana]|uniref:uncharacterized protein n=1 Tax=Aquarana catesbeiana TaxID=8400 RepID=UPI003CC9E208
MSHYYHWIVVVSTLQNYALCTDLCGEMKQVVSQESGDILLQVDKSGVIEISWVFRNTLIAIAKPHESMEEKSRQFKNRLYNGTDGSLSITKLTKDDQGEFAANIRLDNNYDCIQIYNLTVYSKLSDGDIKIHHNVARSETCNVTLTCAVDKKDVSISWNDSNTNTVMKTLTIQVADPYTNSSWTCTASHPVASVSRTVIPLDFCQNDYTMVNLIRLGISGCVLLISCCIFIHHMKTEVMTQRPSTDVI